MSADDRAHIEGDIESWLRQHEQKEILRFVTVGSVDDGKSTLIGRLLHDAQGVYDDQLAAVKKASAKRGFGDGDDDDIDFSLFTDGLRAEREQGITIDVAYRYFSTPRRKYILADTPGHEQYTRNMATGASTADLAIILLDARLGVLPQSRRHAYIASLLGIRHLVVAVNKMDLAGYDRLAYEALRDAFASVVAGLGFETVWPVPISARRGDNVARRSSRTPWYEGPTLLEVLETVTVTRDNARAPLRFPVQYVLRPHLDYRGFAGTLASGTVRPGDAVMVLPSGRATTVRAVDAWEGSLAEADAPRSVTLRLADEVDVSRGDMIVHPGDAPRATRRFVARLVWMSEAPLDARREYFVKHTTRSVRARVESVLARVDLEALREVAPERADSLALNDIARVVVQTHRPLFVDAYQTHRATGAFILVDAATHDTVAAGMITDDDPPAAATSAGRFVSRVTDAERRARAGHDGAAVWLDAAREGAAELAAGVERALFDDGAAVLVLEGPARSLADVAPRCVAAGLVVLCIAEGATVDARDALKSSVPEGRFYEAGTDDGVAAVRGWVRARIVAPSSLNPS